MTYATTTLASGSGYSSFAPIGILAVIIVPICAAVAVALWSYHRLQQHRDDAVAMASYRRLAEEAVANMGELRSEMTKLTEHVAAVEQLMRDVG